MPPPPGYPATRPRCAARVPCGQHTRDAQAQTATRAGQRRMPRGSQTCVTNKPAQNDGLVRGGRAVAEKAGEQQRVASGYARLPRTFQSICRGAHPAPFPAVVPISVYDLLCRSRTSAHLQILSIAKYRSESLSARSASTRPFCFGES